MAMKLRVVGAASLNLAAQIRAQYQNLDTDQMYNHISGVWADDAAFTGGAAGQSFSTAFGKSGESNVYKQEIPALVLASRDRILVALYDAGALTGIKVAGLLDVKTGHIYNPGSFPMSPSHRIKVSDMP